MSNASSHIYIYIGIEYVLSVRMFRCKMEQHAFGSRQVGDVVTAVGGVCGVCGGTGPVPRGTSLVISW